MSAERLVVGHVLSAHGLNGALKVASASGEIAHFHELPRVSLREGRHEQAFSVEWVKSQPPSTVVLKLRGIEERTEAAGYRGADVVAAREHAGPRGEGEYYYGDLCGCSVLLDGKQVGTVLSVWDSGATDMLEVETEEGTKMIPFADRFVGSVNLETRTIELLVGWILE